MTAKQLSIYFGVFVIGVGAFFFALADHKDYNEADIVLASQEATTTEDASVGTSVTLGSNETTASSEATTTTSTMGSRSLIVPYVSEAPDNDWTGPWKNACEEASIAMVNYYYKGDTTVSVATAKTFLSNLFAVENAKYGSNANSDAARTDYLVNNDSDFKGTVVTDPTIDDIKKQIDEGHPVIAFHHGFDLHNPDIPFLPTGSSYHSTVVVGYDDATQEFLVNDPGDEQDGPDHRYSYSVYMNSLHDYDYDTKLADGPARVIFTSSE